MSMCVRERTAVRVCMCVWQTGLMLLWARRKMETERTNNMAAFVLSAEDRWSCTDTRSRFLTGKSVISRRDGNKSGYSPHAGCRPLELSCKLHVRNAKTGCVKCHLPEEHNANLVFLSLLVFFFGFVLFCQNVLGRDKKNKLERDMSTKPTGVFCFRVSYHYPGGASSQLRAPGRVTFNSRPLRVKKQTPSLASSSDWHTIPVGGHKSLTAIARPSLHSADLGNQREGNQRWRTASWAAAACLLTTLRAFFCIFVMGRDHVSDQAQKTYFAIYF